jgi:hypothetical protein
MELAQDRFQSRALVLMVLNLGVLLPQNEYDFTLCLFLTSRFVFTIIFISEIRFVEAAMKVICAKKN